LTIFLISLLSCIKENYDSCVDYGKYRVIFYDIDSSYFRHSYNVIIYPIALKENIAQKACMYVRPADNNLLYSEKTLKLYPMDYAFKALMSRHEMNPDDDLVKLNNGEAYFFADCPGRIRKASENRVGLNFGLFNSLVRIICNLSHDSEGEYEISKVEITPPDNIGIILNINSGKCNYAQNVSDFYEECTFESNAGYIFIYYCVPIIKSNYLNFRVHVDNIVTKKATVLYAKAFLNKNIEQGKVYEFRFNVTPYDIVYKSSSVLDWSDYITATEFTFN